ncbi:hypothetical protein JCM33374_g2430 [Metschnikowia sp. JCM 33374]|nr:hypothetical protein JCM33374_g2430 [Metschnikowia sp. JCM 33374]
MSGTEEDEDLVHNYTLNTQHKLDEFFQRLKSFVYMGTFDVNGLEFQTQDLHEKLTSIRQDLEMMPSSPLLLEQLNFAHIMFSGMSDAVIMLQHFNTCELPGHGWLYKIIELNVRLWTMFDSYGNLDLDISCYVARILEFLRDVHVWGRQFRMLKDVTEDMTALYESQSTEAVKKIFELGSQIPLPHK